MDATHKLTITTTTMLTFGMGASTQALFARVGGGIYTKSSRCRSRPGRQSRSRHPRRRPAQPGNHCRQCGRQRRRCGRHGGGFVRIILRFHSATSALGAAAFVASGDVEMQYKAVVAPMLIAAVGIVLSIIGIFAVRTKENATIRELLKALAIGTNLSSVLIAPSPLSAFFIC